MSIKSESSVEIEQKTSEKFQDPNAELRFISSDGVIFHIYIDHLKSTSEILQVPENTVVDSDSLPVPLTERAEVLELLFQFVHPPSSADEELARHPDLGAIAESNIALFFDLAEAGEKYGVYALKSMCITRMEYMLSKDDTHCIEILDHCLRHSYYERMIDAAAYQTLSKPRADVAKGLRRVEDLKNWVLFYDSYVTFGKLTLDAFKGGSSMTQEQWYANTCNVLKGVYTSYCMKIIVDLSSVTTVDMSSMAASHNVQRGNTYGCSTCDNCRSRVNDSITQRGPYLLTFSQLSAREAES